jgi:hypothetical protein
MGGHRGFNNVSRMYSRRSAVVASGGGIPVGIATGNWLHSNAGTPANVLAVLDLIAGSKARWVREQMTWAYIEDTNNTYDWEFWDALVTECNNRRLKLAPMIGGTPGWAHTGGVDTWGPPTNNSDLGDFVGAAVARYKDWIKVWEIWNEPNLRVFWGDTDTDPVKYAGMLSSAYDAAKAADPTCTVVSAGLAPSETGSGFYDPREYLDIVFDTVGTSKCDLVGYHPYSYPFRPGTFHEQNAWSRIGNMRGLTSGSTLTGTTPSMLSVIADHGATKKLWLSELGAPTYGTGSGATVANNFGADISPPTPQWVDEEVQGIIVDDQARLSRRNPDIIAGALFYTAVDQAAPGVDTDREKHFGIWRSDLATAKAAVGLMNTAVAETGGPG